MAIDENLLKCYMKGFEDELRGNLKIELVDETEKRAYNLGIVHAIIGEDLRSVDYLTEKEILDSIRNGVI